MASLMELVDRVNRGETIDSEMLRVYQGSANSAEKFLAHHAQAMLDLRRAHQHILQSLEAIDYSDQKVLNQFISVSGFLGLSDGRAQPLIRFGGSAIARREYALGLEAIQNGISYDLRHGGAYAADRENGQFVAIQYDRAALGIGWSSGEVRKWNNKQTRIAYVVSSLADDEECARAVRSFARHHDATRFKLHVYSTKAGVRRDRQQFGQTSYSLSSARRGAQTLESLSRQKVETWVGPTEGDLVAAAKALANQLIEDRVDVVIFDATQADSIAAVVAQWDVARVKANLCRRSPLYASGLSIIIYTDRVRFDSDKDYWAGRGVDSKFVLEGIDIDEDFGPVPQRAAYGIPEQAMVLATSSADLDRTICEEFIDTIIHLLRAHPHAVYLLIGEGELSWQKRKFESAGVGKRVGYAGRRKDLPAFLRIADVYLAEFPGSSAAGVLQAMAVEKPVVTMHWGESPEQSQAAAFVETEHTVGGRDPATYLERVSRMIRDSAYRQKLGRAMRARVEEHFAYSQTARHIEQLCERLIQQTGDGRGEQFTLRADDSRPMAEAA